MTSAELRPFFSLILADVRASRLDASQDRGTAGCWTITTTMAQTTLDDWAKDPVDPEIRAHVYSLITAVGHTKIAHRYSQFPNAHVARRHWRRWHLRPRRRRTRVSERLAKMAQVRRRTAESPRCGTMYGRSEPGEGRSAGDSSKGVA